MVKKERHIALFSLCTLLLLAPSISAKSSEYAPLNPFIVQRINISVNALYYFGDVDNESAIFYEGFKLDNLSLGGALGISYSMPVSRHCNLRYSLMGGTLHGNNEANFRRQKREDFRRFNSVLLQPAFGVEIYPCPRAGFFLYAGVAVTGSFITNYEFFYKTSGGALDRVTGSTYGILPMLQLGLGYSWHLNDSWSLSLELMLQEGMVDMHYMNLDAYPLAASQNSKGVELGTSGLFYTNSKGKKSFRWNDGWYQLGLTFSYRWNTCKHCRILNNYNVRY